MSTEKITWKSKSGYIWAMIGSAVGFANILGFGAKCYKNGGAAFLIPLLLSFIILGIPMLIMEGIVGKTFQAPLVASYEKIFGGWGRFFAWPTIMGVITIGGYYCVLNAWSLIYLVLSVTNSIPADTEKFFINDFLKSTSFIGEFGSFSWLIAGVSALIIFITYKINSKSISKGIERLCVIFLPLLMGILVLFLAATFFLPGSVEGMTNFIRPDFKKLASSKLWIESFGHVFFSLSIGLGIIVGYSRYASKKINIVRSMVLVALGDLITSFLAGLVIFGVLGYMAQISNKEFAEVVSSSGFGLGFVVFPKIIQSFPSFLSSIVGGLFFFCLFIAGISGFVSIVEASAGNLEYEFAWSRKKSVAVSLSIMSAFTAIFCFGNGVAIIDTLDKMTAGLNVLISGLLQIVCFMWLCNKIPNDNEWFLGKRKAFYFYSLKWLSPVLLAVIIITHLVGEINSAKDISFAIRWIWFAMVYVASFLISRNSFVGSQRRNQLSENKGFSDLAEHGKTS